MVKCIYCDQPAEMRVIGHGWIPTPKHHLPLCRKHCIEAEEGGYDKQKAAWDEYHRQRSETKVLAQYPPSASPAELLALFKKSYGEEAVIRTSPRWDKAVEHLGYSSVDSPPVAGVMTDEELVRDSQERLQKVTAVDAGTLSPQRRAVLQVSRALCQDFSPSISSIEAAQIPPASQRVRTAGLYNRGTGQMYVALEQLDRGKSAIDTVIHEMAHHTSGADDGELAHAEEIKNLAGKVVASVASRKYDALLKNPEFTW